MILPAIQKAVFDEMLPKISNLLDVSRMRSTFEHALGCRVEDCKIIRAKLRPGRNCLVSYRLDVPDPETGEVREQLVTLVSFGKGESDNRFNLARQKPLTRTAIGGGLFHLPALEAVVWAFPNDRKLGGLPAITDSTKLKGLLSEVLANSFGEGWEIAALGSEVLSYAAERGCTVRVKVELSNLRTGEVLAQTVFGKTYCPGEGEVVWQTMRRLWQHGSLLIPHPLSFQSEINTLWQQGLIGKTLGAFDAESEKLRGWLGRAGAMVAELHRLKVSDWLLREALRPIEELATAETLLASAVPGCKSDLQALVSQLTGAFGRIGIRPATILHGDLHPKNFFASGEQIALLDWDNVCFGDPLQELGSLAASLHYRGFLEGRSVQTTGRLIDAFVDAYRAVSDLKFSASPLNWHTAAALVYERAYRHVIRMKADAPGVVADLIELARRLIEKL